MDELIVCTVFPSSSRTSCFAQFQILLPNPSPLPRKILFSRCSMTDHFFYQWIVILFDILRCADLVWWHILTLHPPPPEKTPSRSMEPLKKCISDATKIDSVQWLNWVSCFQMEKKESSCGCNSKSSCIVFVNEVKSVQRIHRQSKKVFTEI